MHKPLKWVFFDFDGTLADSQPMAYQIYVDMANKYDMNILSVEAIEALRQLPLKARLKTMGIPFYKVPGLLKASWDSAEKHMDQALLYPGIKSLVLTLKKQDIRCAIISSNHPDNIKRFLHAVTLDVFDEIIGKASLFGKHKNIKRLIKKVGITSDDMVYVGDETRDIVASKKAKVRIIAVTWGLDKKPLLAHENPNYIVDDAQALKARLMSLK